MFFSSLSQPSPSLKISFITGNVFFLHPQSDTLSPPLPDPLLRGIVTLSLPKPREIHNVVVSLAMDYKIMFPSGPTERARTVVNKVDIPLAHTMMGKGDHSFDFELPIPASSAPYERNKFGFILHYVVVDIKGPGLSLNECKEVSLSANPAEEGTVSGVDLEMKGFQDEIGLYSISASSPHLTVAGLLNFRFSIPHPPAPLSIHSIRAEISQYISLHSPSDSSHIVHMPPQRVSLLTLDVDRPPKDTSHLPRVIPNTNSKYQAIEVLATLEEGEAYQARHSIRIPNGLSLRPTTQPGSNTPFRTRHELCVDVTFQLEGSQKKRILKITRPLTHILSCYCTLESLLVPSYTPIDQLPKSRLSVIEIDRGRMGESSQCARYVSCACGLSLETLLQQQEMLKTVEGSGAPKKWEYGVAVKADGC